MNKHKNHFKMLLMVTTTVALCTVVSEADPVPSSPKVFCFRITDIEQNSIDSNTYTFEFETLNWTDMDVAGVYIALTVGNKPFVGAAPSIINASIDPDGRGGSTGNFVCVDDLAMPCSPDVNGQDVSCPGTTDCQLVHICVDDTAIDCTPDAGGLDTTNCPASNACIIKLDIGAGVFESPSHQSGRGRGDIAGLGNDWVVTSSSTSAIMWNAGPTGTPIPSIDMLAAATGAAQFALVPGTDNDATGDTAIDGGPEPYVNDGLGSALMAPVPDGSGNVLDGFVVTVKNFDENERFSINWFLLDSAGNPIGTPASGNLFGFGVINIARVTPGSVPPDGMFVGNNEYVRDPNFFGTVHTVPAPVSAEFFLEFGPTLTAEFKFGSDNIFNVGPNTLEIPTVSEWGLATMLLLVMVTGTVVFRKLTAQRVA